MSVDYVVNGFLNSSGYALLHAPGLSAMSCHAIV